MPVDLFQALAAIESEDGQLKTAAKKLGHEPEMGHMDAGGTASGLGQAVGRGPMDAKALLDERALEAAGTELEGRTFQDPRERSGARNLATRPAPGPASPTDASRPATKPSNVHLPKTGPATHRPDSLTGGKTAGVKDLAARFGNKARAVGERAAAKGRSAATRVGMTVRSHPGKAMAAAGAAGAAGGFMAGRRKKKASLSLAQFVEAVGAGEAGVKLASQAYGDREVLARTIQMREAQSTGMKLACGMFKAAAAEAQG